MLRITEEKILMSKNFLIYSNLLINALYNMYFPSDMQNVSATETTSNITVHEQSVTYHVQVTATISTPSGAVRETDLSALSPTSTIVVPPPGK